VPDDDLRPVQRTAAYAVVTDPDGAVLLVHASPRSDYAGRWFLPGGGVGHGEAPRDAVVREVAEETGLDVRVTGPRAVVADTLDLPHRGVRVHTLRVLYDARPAGGWPVNGLRPEPDGTSDRVELVPADRLPELPLMPYVGAALGLSTGDGDLPPATVPERPQPLLDAGPAGEDAEAAALAADVVVRMQRPAAYAVVREGGRVLLTRLRDSGGLWTLPGGGIDHGEEPLVAVVREVWEETGLELTPGRLVAVTSRHFTGHAPNGRLEDFHAIRLVYDGTVAPGEPRVTEVGGSTEAVAWLPLADLGGLKLADVVHEGLAAVGVDVP
jgi:8-oxo-dGTP pyrophosphatase MutT (NUDIX family)